MTLEKLKELPSPQETYIKFKELLDKYINKYDKEDKFFIGGHNVQFDIDFLKLFFERMGDKFFGSYFQYKPIDLMAFCTILHTAGLINLSSWKLENIANYLCIEYDNNLHNAKTDIDLTRKCFCKLFKDFIKF